MRFQASRSFTEVAPWDVAVHEAPGQGCVHVRALGYAIEVWYVRQGELAVASR